MEDYISKLPDDILIHLLSFLPVRDAVRTRSLSPRWKDLPDCRSILEFNSLSVLGKNDNDDDEFVKAVNQFLEIWKAPKISKFKLEFCLAKEYDSHIDGWIASVTGKRVEELDLNLVESRVRAPNYVLSCHLFHSEASCLKHLRLICCQLTLCSGCKSGCKSWLTRLTTLELCRVTLLTSDMDHILSAALNLTSLTMRSIVSCNGYKDCLNVKLPYLKKLVVSTLVVSTGSVIYLDCPYLEIFDYTNKCCDKITFSHLPCLREVYLRIFCRMDGCCLSKFVHHLTRNAPKLHHLFLVVITEVPPTLASIVTHSLKQLHLHLCVPVGFDLFIITDFLHASPILEELHIEMKYRFEIKRSPIRQYLDRLHFHLKKVTFERYSEMWKEMEFVIYLLRNSITLEQLVIVPEKKSKLTKELNFNLLQGVHPSAEVIISHPIAEGIISRPIAEGIISRPIAEDIISHQK